jgi:hypothetical protein
MPSASTGPSTVIARNRLNIINLIKWILSFMQR